MCRSLQYMKWVEDGWALQKIVGHNEDESTWSVVRHVYGIFIDHVWLERVHSLGRTWKSGLHVQFYQGEHRVMLGNQYGGGDPANETHILRTGQRAACDR